jgi:pimeloyl-ACP methyl ester carboxylesterase
MFADDSNASSVANALLAAGYIVASTVGNATGTEFGSPKLQDAQAALYKFVRDHYNIGPVMIYGISMGGLGSLMSAVDPRIPGVKAWCASSPLTSLAYAYAKTSEGWDAEMRTEYGIAVGGADYAAKTAGSDPMLLPTSRFAGLPMYVIASPADTVVAKSSNTDALVTRLTGVTSISTTTASGEHNDASQYPAAKIVAFFDQFA